MRIICIFNGSLIKKEGPPRSDANFQETDFDFAQLDGWSFLKPRRPQTKVHADIRPKPDAREPLFKPPWGSYMQQPSSRRGV
jgi:hypothetical protein